MERRKFIQTTTSAAAAFILAADILNAEEEKPQNPMLKRINTELMGSKGEITASFLLTLNPRPCSHFNEEQKKSKSTEPELIKKIYRDLVLHGNKPEHIKEACRAAQKQWEAEQGNKNNPAPSPG